MAGSSTTVGRFVIDVFFSHKKGKKGMTKLRRDVDAMANHVNKASAHMQRMMVNAFRIGSRALYSFGKDALKVGVGYEKVISQIHGVTSATTAQMAALKKHSRFLGKTTAFTASQAAEGMLELSKAGLSVEQVIDASTHVLHLAGATNTEFSKTVKSVIAAMRQFNLDTDQTRRIVDTFSMATSSSLLDMTSLTEAMKFGGAAGKAYGMTLEETVASLAKFRDIGLEGSLAGTNFRMALAQASIETGRKRKALKRLKLTMDDVNPEMNSFADIIDVVRKNSIGAEDATILFGRRSGSQMVLLGQQITSNEKALALLKQKFSDGVIDESTYNKEIKKFQTIRSLTETISKNAGHAKKRYDLFMDTIAGRTAIVRSKFEDLKLTIYDILKAPLRGFLSSLGTGIDVFVAEIDESFYDIQAQVYRLGDAISEMLQPDGDFNLGRILEEVVSHAADLVEAFNTGKGKQFFRDLVAAARIFLKFIMLIIPHFQLLLDVMIATWAIRRVILFAQALTTVLGIMRALSLSTAAMSLGIIGAAAAAVGLLMKLKMFDPLMRKIREGEGPLKQDIFKYQKQRGKLRTTRMTGFTGDWSKGTKGTQFEGLDETINFTQAQFSALRKTLEDVNEAMWGEMVKEAKRSNLEIAKHTEGGFMATFKVIDELNKAGREGKYLPAQSMEKLQTFAEGVMKDPFVKYTRTADFGDLADKFKKVFDLGPEFRGKPYAGATTRWISDLEADIKKPANVAKMNDAFKHIFGEVEGPKMLKLLTKQTKDFEKIGVFSERTVDLLDFMKSLPESVRHSEKMRTAFLQMANSAMSMQYMGSPTAVKAYKEVHKGNTVAIDYYNEFIKRSAWLLKNAAKRQQLQQRILAVKKAIGKEGAIEKRTEEEMRKLEEERKKLDKEISKIKREEAKARKALLRQQESMAKMQKLENERLRDILKTLDKIRDRHQKIKESIQGLQEEDKFKPGKEREEGMFEFGLQKERAAAKKFFDDLLKDQKRADKKALEDSKLNARERAIVKKNFQKKIEEIQRKSNAAMADKDREIELKRRQRSRNALEEMQKDLADTLEEFRVEQLSAEDKLTDEKIKLLKKYLDGKVKLTSEEKKLIEEYYAWRLGKLNEAKEKESKKEEKDKKREQREREKEEREREKSDIEKLVEKLKKIRDIIRDWWMTVALMFVEIYKIIGGVFGPIAEAIAGVAAGLIGFGEAAGRIKPAMKEIAKNLSLYLVIPFQYASHNIKAAIDVIKKGLSGGTLGFNDFKKILAGMISPLTVIDSLITSIFTTKQYDSGGFLTDLFVNKIPNLFVKGMSNASKKVGKLYKKILEIPFVGWLASFIGPVLKLMTSGVLAVSKAVMGKLLAVIGKAFKMVSDTLQLAGKMVIGISKFIKSSVDIASNLIFGSSVTGLISTGLQQEERDEEGNITQESGANQLKAIFEKGIEKIGALENLDEVFVTVMEGLTTGLSLLAEKLPALLTDAITAFADNIDELVIALLEVLRSLLSVLPELIGAVIKGVTTFIEGIPDLVYEILTAVLALLADLPSILTKLIKSIYSAVTDIIIMIFEGDFIGQLITAVVKLALAIITVIAKEMPKLITAVVTALPGLVTGLVSMIPDLIIAITEALPDIILALVEALPALIWALIVAAPRIIWALIKGIPDIALALINILPTVLSELAKGLGKAVSKAFSGDLFDKAWKSIVKYWDKVFSDMGRWWGNIGNWFWRLFKRIGDWLLEIVTLGWAETDTYGDTPGVLRSKGKNLRFAVGDYFAAARTPEALVNQVMNMAGYMGTRGLRAPTMEFGFDRMAESIVNRGPGSGASSMNANINVIVDGTVLDKVIVNAYNDDRAPELKKIIRDKSSVKVGLDRGRNAS
tara:strand:- start:22103 stop:27697 length:5595 start_codon:yes stop_codon:yes gene_type:complete